MSTKKLVSASFANLLIPLSGLVVSPFLSRELGPEGRGLYAALTLPIVVCGWIGTYGLQDALSFHVRDSRISKRAAAKVSVIASVPLGLLGIALLGVLGLFIFTGSSGHYRQFLTLSLLAPLHILSNLLIGALTGASDIRGVNLVKVVPSLARTALVIFACLAFDLNAYWASLLFMASVAGGLAIGLARLRSAPTTEEAKTAPIGAIPTRSLVTYSLTCMPGVLAAISSARLDQIIGLPVIGAQQLGYYAVAVSVAEIPMVIATAARTVLMGKPTTSDPRRGTQVARLAVLTSVLASGLLAAIASVAVPWVFGRPFTPAVVPTVILCAATTLYTCMVIFSAVLLANNKAGWSSAALVTGSLVGIALLFLLAPLGAIGAAIASVGGYGISVVVAAWAVGKVPDMHSLRMLTIPYWEDVRSFRDMLGGLFGRRHAAATAGPAPQTARPQPRTLAQHLLARIVAVYRRTGTETIGVSVLIILAWLRVLIPQLIQLFSTGRPAFNSREDVVPAAGNVVGDAISLAFIVLAALLAARGIWRHRSSNLRWLAVAIAPLAAIEISGLLNHQRPNAVSLALPLAAVAMWLQPAKRQILAMIGILGVITAAASILLALLRPDLALLTGAAAGGKSGLLGGLLAGPYLHSNVLGIALAVSTPFVFCIGNVLDRRVSLVVILFALFWTGSRTSQIATAVVLLAYVLIRRFPTRIWLLSVPIAAGLSMIVLAPLLTTDPDSFTRRGRIWDVLLDQWAERPVLGFGAEYFQRQPELARDLGGQFNHGHNVMVQLLVVGGLLTVALFAVLLHLTWRQSIALAKAGVPAGALFLIALVHISWLEASHVSTTLAGYATWLPLILIARLGLDLPSGLQPDPGKGEPSDGSGGRARPVGGRLAGTAAASQQG